MTLNLQLPQRDDHLRPHITVVGVGGAGGNAVNNMVSSNLEGVNFVVANTDAQALSHSLAERCVQLGVGVTSGLGAGASPEVGRAAAEESIDEIESHLQGSNMVFITAGMGGGTGTGAAPVIARLAREMGVLTVGVVTKPFQFEGAHRMRIAENGVESLQEYVDTLIVIPNQNLFRIANEKTTFADAFSMADNVLHSGVRGVTDLIVMPGLINLDFADIRAVMSEMGKAVMGTGEADGERRALDAAEAAISNPLLDDMSMKGARGMLINVTGGPDMTLFEVDEVANRVREEVDSDANIIFGATFNEGLEGKVRVSVVATGIGNEERAAAKTMVPVGRATPFKTMRSESSASPTAERTVENAVSAMMSSAPAPMAAASEPVAPVVKREAPVAETANRSYTSDTPRQELPTSHAKSHAVAESNSDQYGFVPPRPADPGINPSSYMRPVNTFTKVEQKPEASEQEASAKDDAGSFSFMQKFAGVGKAISSRVETRSPSTQDSDVMVKERTAPQSSAATGTGSDDYLDIPAFLRRQAN